MMMGESEAEDEMMKWPFNKSSFFYLFLLQKLLREGKLEIKFPLPKNVHREYFLAGELFLGLVTQGEET